jgi:hypothetical protein
VLNTATDWINQDQFLLRHCAERWRRFGDPAYAEALLACMEWRGPGEMEEFEEMFLRRLEG